MPPIVNLNLILAIASAIAGAFATLLTLVLLLAGGANASPQRITQLKWMLLAVAVVGVAGLAGSIWAMATRHHWLAVAAGASPVVFAVVLIVVLIKLEW